MNGPIKLPLQAFEQQCTLQREDPLGLSPAVTALRPAELKQKIGEAISAPHWLAVLVASSTERKLCSQPAIRQRKAKWHLLGKARPFVLSPFRCLSSLAFPLKDFDQVYKNLIFPRRRCLS